MSLRASKRAGKHNHLAVHSSHPRASDGAPLTNDRRLSAPALATEVCEPRAHHRHGNRGRIGDAGAVRPVRRFAVGLRLRRRRDDNVLGSFRGTLAVVAGDIPNPVDAGHRSGTRRVPAHRPRVVPDFRDHRDHHAARQDRPGPGLPGGRASRRHNGIADEPQHLAPVRRPEAGAGRIPDQGIGDRRPLWCLTSCAGTGAQPQRRLRRGRYLHSGIRTATRRDARGSRPRDPDSW